MSTKRSLGLEDYASSEDEEELLPAPPAKRRKLPALAQSIVIQRPVDDPALHQGRIRSSPFVEGQWAAYVYAPIRLGPRSPLRRFLSDVITHSKDLAPTLHSSVDAKNGDRDIELHISLTRPIYLRAHQREELRRSVKRIAESNAP
jgi:U6 snRNA phosphodiesterase